MKKSLKLVVSKNGESLEEKELRVDAETVIGRSADLVLSHKSISRRHASICPVKSEGEVVLSSFAKDGGTRLNKIDLKTNEQVSLSDGDIIEFGKSSKSYRVVMGGWFSKEVANVDDSPACDDPQQSSSSTSSHVYESAPLPVLSSREEREKEIAAMTASMMSKPVALVDVKREDEGDESSSDDEGFGPQPLTAEQQKAHIKKQEESRKHSVDEAAKALKIPISCSVDLSKHSKTVTCLSCNPSGNRVASGFQDGTLKIFDFGGMDSRQEAFKEITPESGVAINDVCHSPSGSHMMVITSNAQPLLFDKEGVFQRKCIRGDMYLTDLTNTKGHTSEVSCAAWHPDDNNLVITGGADGTLRLWDTTSELYLDMLRNKSVMKVRGKQGGNQARVPVNSCCFSPDGRLMIAGCEDGSVHVWDEKNVGRARGVLRNSASAITFVACISSSVTKGRDVLVAKSEEGVVYMWDLRAVHSPTCRPFAICEGCPNDSAGSNVAFSPDASLICVPTISLKGSAVSSRLRFFNTDSYKDRAEPLESCLEIVIDGDFRATRVIWQKHTNQILVAMSSGTTKVFFDPDISTKGVMLSVKKAPPRKKDPMDFVQHVGEIYAPHALPMFKDGHLHDKLKGRRKKEEGASEAMAPKKDAANSKVIITTSEATKYIVNGRGDIVNSREVNPRDALLQMHDKVAGTNKDGPVLATKTFEEEEDELRAMKRQRKE